MSYSVLNADTYYLNKVRWQFFGTLTFKTEIPPEFIRLSMFYKLMRQTAKAQRIHFQRLPWCLKQERGDTLGTLHFHFLLTGLPKRSVTEKTCRQIESKWRSGGGGISKVTLFNPSLSGCDYLAKQNAPNADQRESAKFGVQSCELMPSRAVMKILKAQIRVESTLSTLKTR